jgi:dCTP deaminase
MTMLSDRSLLKLIRDEFMPSCHVGPNSVDLTLSNTYARPALPEGQSALRLGERIQYEEVVASEYLLRPGEFVLAATNEVVEVPDTMGALVHGRSSIGRAGLQIQNAGFIDAGFEGTITLELHNQGEHPLILPSGIRICQISFIRLDAPAKYPYNGKYQNQDKATGSRLHLDSEFEE